MNTMCKTNEKKQKCVPVVFFYEEGKERKGKALKGEDEVRSRRSSSPINEEKRRVKNGATRV